MNAKRPNPQLPLPFTQAEPGEARDAPVRQGVEVFVTSSEPESPASSAASLMEVIGRTQNLSEAMRHVVANRGAPGVDGMTVHELADHWPRHGTRIVEELLSGRYRPAPVKRVEIPKPDGGVRKLGIPTGVDRMIQQAVLQVLQPIWEPTFSEHSYGFRPGRSAHQAVAQAQAYIAAGRSWVVDLDLEKFFDRVNHDKLMRTLYGQIADGRVLHLIRGYLNAGVLEDGLVTPSEEGTPQGGPLSPLLSNIVLDELDRELERRGHAFVRYADDCNIYVPSAAAGRRVMESISKFITRKLKLKVNRDKSAVDQPRRRKFLGFTFSEKKTTVLVSGKSLKRFKGRIRELTRRGVPVLRMIADLNPYLRGWAGYFGHAGDSWTLRDLDSWIRRRLRSLAWRAWRTPHKRFRELTRRGVLRRDAVRMVRYHRRAWRASRMPALHTALPNLLWHDHLRLLSLLRTWRQMHAQS